MCKRQIAVLAATLLAALGVLGVGGCGSSQPDPSSSSAARETGSVPAAAKSSGEVAAATTCARISNDGIERVVATATGQRASGLELQASRSSGLLSCRYAAPGLKIHINLDTATDSRKRYQNRVVELAQFGYDDPKLAPHPVKGVGDEINGGGANWVPATSQLFTVEGSRYLIIDFYAKGAPPDRLRDGAVQLARMAFARLPGN